MSAALLLQGTRVIELEGIGPAPFAAMLLADLGAEVLTIRRPGQPPSLGGLTRGRPSLEVDLKDPEVRNALLEVIAGADVLIEGFRPGVTERLGLGPADCHAVNRGLVYGRMTGWGQDAPRSSTAGHDLTYLAIAGALHLATRRGQPPTPPANLLGDFGGGGMFLVAAVLSALIERSTTGTGRVLDVAILDGVTYLNSMMVGMRAEGQWSDEPASNLLDTGCPFYDVYECADGRWLAVAPLEPQFFAETVRILGLDESWNSRRGDRALWPRLREEMAAAVRSRTRDEWDALAADTDACIAPVLDLGEAHAARPDLYAPDTVPAGMPRLPWADGAPDATPATDRLRLWGAGEPVVRALSD